jgi:hypothetical protein
MAQQLYFSRDTKVYVKIGSDVWEVPVLDGFSFAQATNSSEIVLAEMESAGGVSRRGKRMFNDSLAPAEWSFTTYVRPFVSVGSGTGAADGSARTHAVDEVLLALLAGPAVYDGVNYHFEDDSNNAYFNWDSAGTTLTVDFARSNKSTLGTASIIFRVGDGTVNYKYYEITGCVANEAGIDFDIDGIASINWSGMGSLIQETTAPTVTVNESITSTTNFIRNRLTQMVISPNTASYTSAQAAQLETSYSITLTGGSITISNNITYIIPEELGIVNIPIGHVTGNRSFGGTFTCYLVDDDGNTTESGDFWQDVAALSEVVTHDFDITFNIGGTTGDPRMSVNFAQAAIEIPTHSIEDIISLETNFSGLPSTIDATDEGTISYYAT